ncbi:SepM family pheromone-processing serine protease [Carnobacterium sp. TMP28]|uniref:SepM family pheromone-processing serine protease n=1 Tax=Carnobacterium sp. TMP28 TaxID=3397060 RepID=UPI0039E10E67
MKKIKNNKTISLVVATLFLVLGLTVPLPYYIEAPGSAVRLNELIEVNNKVDENPGSFMLTTVSIRRATPLIYFTKYLPFHEGVTKKELFGTTESSQEYDNLQKYYMDSSINAAIELAYKTANEEYTLNYEGIYVMSILPESNFSEKLFVGDTVTALDSQKFKSSAEFIDYVKSRSPGQAIAVTYQRENKENTISAPLIEIEQTKAAGLGISLVDRTSIETDIPVSIDSEDIGGPSAGFMYTLQLYAQLIKQDLRKGNEIAGTGTISPDGTIGRIGGIDKKVVAASKEGATIFFAPDDSINSVIKKNYPNTQSNYEEALKAAEKIDTEMKIIPVKHFQDAINYLKQLK